MADEEVTQAQEVVEGQNEDTEQPEAGETQAAGGEEASAPETPSPDADTREREWQERFQRLERANAELHDMVSRTSERREATRQTEEKPPNFDLSTREGLDAYLAYREQRLADTLSQHSTTTATAVASEQRARGLYNRDVMGPGRDYDSLVSKHIEPVEKNDPGFRRVFQNQRNPAAAKYVLAAALEVIDRAGGDPVKGLSNLWKAIDGRTSTTREIVDKIKQGSERQVGKTGLRGGRSAAQSKGLPSESEIRGMSPSEFAADPRFKHLIQ